MLHLLLKHSTSQHRKKKNEAYIERLSFTEEKIKGMVGGCVFLSPVEVAVSDTLNSSTTKTTHFKGSEDGAGDLRELKDRRRNFGPFFLLLRSSRESERGRKRREKRLVGREGVISRLRTHKHKAHDKCVGVQK